VDVATCTQTRFVESSQHLETSCSTFLHCTFHHITCSQPQRQQEESLSPAFYAIFRDISQLQNHQRPISTSPSASSSHPTLLDVALAALNTLSSCESPKSFNWLLLSPHVLGHSVPSPIAYQTHTHPDGVRANMCRNYVQLEKLGEGTYATVYKVSRVPHTLLSALASPAMRFVLHQVKCRRHCE